MFLKENWRIPFQLSMPPWVAVGSSAACVWGTGTGYSYPTQPQTRRCNTSGIPSRTPSKYSELKRSCQHSAMSYRATTMLRWCTLTWTRCASMIMDGRGAVNFWHNDLFEIPANELAWTYCQPSHIQHGNPRILTFPRIRTSGSFFAADSVARL